MYKVFETVDEVSNYTAQKLLDIVHAKPKAILGLATGSTMEPIYARLIEYLQSFPVDLSQLITFNLDEYIGLNAKHPQSYCCYMHHHLFDKLCLSDDRVNLPDGMISDVECTCQAYSEAIRALGGLDLQLLGIGSNGHIGFNEPYTSFSSRTHVIELTEQTRIDNSRFFTDKSEMPTHAITLGIQDIFEAKEIILVATGKNKANIMNKLFHGEVDESLPASVVKQHPKATIVLDAEAAALFRDKI